MVTMGDQNELQISWFFHDDDDTIFVQHSLTQKAFYIKAVAFTHYTCVLETVTLGGYVTLLLPLSPSDLFHTALLLQWNVISVWKEESVEALVSSPGS